jgi:hypothetical protein
MVRGGDASAGRINGLISACSVSVSRKQMFATTVRDANGSLRIIIRDLDDEGNVARKGFALDDEVGFILICPVKSEDLTGCVHAIRCPRAIQCHLNAWRVEISLEIMSSS